jgi:hypothetical protein
MIHTTTYSQRPVAAGQLRGAGAERYTRSDRESCLIADDISVAHQTGSEVEHALDLREI